MMVAIQAGEGGYCIVHPAHNTQVTPRPALPRSVSGPSVTFRNSIFLEAPVVGRASSIGFQC